jgi:uncharacterized C2H2 Zn-finger protein
VEKHERTHFCPVAGCLYATLGFSAARDLTRHSKSHEVVFTEEDFPEPELQVEERATRGHSASSPPLVSEVPDNTFTNQDQDSQHAPHAVIRPGSDRSQTAVSMSTGNSSLTERTPTRKPKQPRIEDGYPCAQCAKCYDTAGHLRKHVARAHLPESERKLWCPRCEARFLWPKDLTRHMRLIHVAERSLKDLDQNAPHDWDWPPAWSTPLPDELFIFDDTHSSAPPDSLSLATENH